MYTIFRFFCLKKHGTSMTAAAACMGNKTPPNVCFLSPPNSLGFADRRAQRMHSSELLFSLHTHNSSSGGGSSNPVNGRACCCGMTWPMILATAPCSMLFHDHNHPMAQVKQENDPKKKRLQQSSTPPLTGHAPTTGGACSGEKPRVQS